MDTIKKGFVKENRFRIGAMIVVIVLVGFATKLSISYIKAALEKNNAQSLNEISEESSRLISEKISADVEVLNAVADIIAKEDDIFSQKNIENITALAQNEPYHKVFLIDMQGDMRSSDGEWGKQVTIIARVKRNGVVISDVNTEETGENTLTISVPVVQGGQIIGALTGVYQAEEYSRIMETTLFTGEGIHYILKSTGEAIVLPQQDAYSFGFSYESNFAQNVLFSSNHELSKLPNEMKASKTGVIKFISNEDDAHYIAYSPLGINDWYLLSVMPAGQYSLESIMDLIIKFAALVDIIIIFLIGVAVAFYERNKKGILDVDSITQLGNKQKLQKFYKNKKGYIFAMIGIDGFDNINHTFGYRVGSEILKNTADVITPLLEKEEVAARLAEDKFGLFLQSKNKSEATKHIKKIIESLAQVQIVEGEIVYEDKISYSAGVNLITEKEDFDTLVQNTTSALEYAKASSGEKIVFFDKELKQQMLLHNALVPDMYRALQNQEFIPYFLIQFDTEQKEFVGAKIISAWNHPQQGIIMQEQFLSVLQETGITLEFDMIMLEQVCKKQKEWIDRKLVPLPLTLSISRMNLYRADFVNRLKTIVERYRVSPSLLVLEITEQAIYDNINRSIRIIEQLKNYGFLISIAGFRSEYGFLNIMKKVSLDHIKLESSFLPKEDAKERERIIIKTVADTARELGTQIIAENITSDKQIKFLKNIGYSVVQGYSYPEPVSEEKFEEMIFYEEI